MHLNTRPMNKYRILILILAIPIIVFTSCYPDNKITPEETDTVYTNWLPGTEFGEMKYYLIVDSVLRYDSSDLFGNSQYDELILSCFEENLESRGFKNAAGQDSSLVDFLVLITDVSHMDITYYWSWFPYGYLYPGFYDEDLNAFYPLPPPTSIVIGTRSGILADLIEYNYQQTMDTSAVYWRGLSNGVLTDGMDSRIKSNIDRMFIQSPNLKSQQR